MPAVAGDHRGAAPRRRPPPRPLPDLQRDSSHARSSDLADRDPRAYCRQGRSQRRPDRAPAPGLASMHCLPSARGQARRRASLAGKGWTALAKVDFKLNDLLLRRSEASSPRRTPRSPRTRRGSLADPLCPAEPSRRLARPPGLSQTDPQPGEASRCRRRCFFPGASGTASQLLPARLPGAPPPPASSSTSSMPRRPGPRTRRPRTSTVPSSPTRPNRSRQELRGTQPPPASRAPLRARRASTRPRRGRRTRRHTSAPRRGNDHHSRSHNRRAGPRAHGRAASGNLPSRLGAVARRLSSRCLGEKHVAAYPNRLNEHVHCASTSFISGACRA